MREEHKVMASKIKAPRKILNLRKVKQLKKGRGIKINENLQFVLYFRNYESGKL
jgi:hypothetical protein